MHLDTQDRGAGSSSGLLSTARAAASALTPGRPGELEIRQVVVETNQGFLITMEAGRNTNLVAFTAPDAELGIAAYAMAKIIASVVLDALERDEMR